jgi:hypothetical protein
MVVLGMTLVVQKGTVGDITRIMTDLAFRLVFPGREIVL